MEKQIESNIQADLQVDTDIKSERQHKTMWMLSFYGTAIGAGTLFLPIEAGLNGIFPLIIMAILSFPMTYFSHRALCRLVLSSNSKKSDITDVVEEYFGRNAGLILTFLYFLAIFPILLMYSVGITNTVDNFITNQAHLNSPPRAVLALILISGLLAIVRFGSTAILKVMSYLVYPFIAALVFLSFYLIPYWDFAILHYQTPSIAQVPSVLTSIWLIIPVIVFSFNHSPVISSFALNQKQRYSGGYDAKSSNLLKHSNILMVFTVMFFVLSCVFSLNPSELAAAKQLNISILSYLANRFDNQVIAYFGPIIAFIAITKSFLGHYLGAKEGLQGLLVKIFSDKSNLIKSSKSIIFIELSMLVTCWVTATINPNILKMIETISGPAIAIILFLLPMYALAKVPAMKQYRSFYADIFITLMGIIAVSVIFYGIFN